VSLRSLTGYPTTELLDVDTSKQRAETKIITQRQRQHFFFHPHGTANCQETVEWGDKETQCPFWLLVESATTGGYFEI
jgi:hypothetical protein